jgi:nucleoside-diphosphate-sugar epimerase
MKVLVTGANGFVGGAVCRALADAGMQVAAASRRDMAVPTGVTLCRAAELGRGSDWREALAGMDAVVHLAARAHVMKDDAADPLAVFRTVNRDGAVALAEQAAAAGLRRLVFMSTIKVNGEATAPGRPFRADDVPAPGDPYGIAKAEAEAELATIAVRTGLELVVIRPPLVHGPGAKGNLAALMVLIARGLPLPLASVDNRRSLVGVANLADLVRTCLVHPDAPGKTFLVRDDSDLATPELIRRLARAMGRPARLLPCPPGLLRTAAAAVGRKGMASRLLGSLEVDDGLTRATLGWQPPVSLDAGLAAMAKAIS